VIAVLAAAFLLAGCGVTPDKPARATLYDFGPGAAAAEPAAATPLAPLVLADVESSSAFDGPAVLYRLGYADAHELRQYAHARWSAPPPQLIRQRLREQLARDRAVLDTTETTALARTGGAMPRILRVQLEEFTQWFDTPARSSGLLRLRVSLMDNTAAGERLLGQRSVVVRQTAPTPDAPGGVRALTAAADAAAAEIAQWLQQQH
jgi:cholesterol transport system auxiliary component